MLTPDYWTRAGENAWCPGCGNFGILAALKAALAELQLEPWRVCIVSGIGQAGKLPHYVKCNFLHGLHGRALPAAIGVKLANPGLKVIAVGGDGDMYGEGGGALLHAFRRNPEITCLVHNNGVYGLTKGQPSPTSPPGFRTHATPAGTGLPGFNPLAAGIAMSGSFVARGFAGDRAGLVRLIVLALKHKGFGFIDILQPCVTYNKVNTHQWYQERVFDLGAQQHDPLDIEQALERALEWPDKDPEGRIPLGLFYSAVRPSYGEQLPALKRGAPVDARVGPEQVRQAIEEFR